MMTESTNSAAKLYEKSSLIKEKAGLEQEVEEWTFWTNRQKTLKNINTGDLPNQLEPIKEIDYLDGTVAGASTDD